MLSTVNSFYVGSILVRCAFLVRLAHRTSPSDLSSQSTSPSTAHGRVGRLKRGRDALLSPRKKTIEEHLSSANMRALQPPLPGDIAVSFYVQSARLTLAVYHLVPQLGSLRFDSFLAECLVPRLEQALAGYARAFQLCQQIKNKLFWAMSRCREGPRPAAPAAGLQNGVG